LARTRPAGPTGRAAATAGGLNGSGPSRGAGPNWRPQPFASLVAAAELLTADLLAGELTPSRLKTVVRQVEERAALPAGAALPALHALVARDTRFLSSEPSIAVEVQLRALLLFGPVRHVSLWLSEDGKEICVDSLGASPTLRRLRGIARRTLAGDRPRTTGGPKCMLHAFPVHSGDLRAALVVEAKGRSAARTIVFAEETARVLVSVLERLLPRDQASLASAELLNAADRRVARIGFDLHDGPLQDVSLLVAELSSFRQQLDLLVTDDGRRRIAQGRVADLSTIATAIAEELREIAAAGGRPTSSLRHTLEQTTGRFERRNGIDVRLHVEGEVDRTTASQRIAVARVVEEALANVREHSRATRVEITVRRDDDRIHVSVVDDGQGFDVARTRRRAAREQRLGLAVMAERARLLGGRLEIDSRPGGPTLLTASLPAWEA
jgi:signal transduction histidine kinase